MRKFKGREANLFTDKKAVRTGALISTILSSICVDVQDPGPYQLGSDGKPLWDGLLTGDRLITLIDARVGTYDSELSFKCQCDEDTCRATWTEDIDLVTDMKRKVLTPESRTTFENGNPFTTYVRDDNGVEHQVKFHLTTGKDELAMMNVARRHKQQQATASLGQRIDAIDGVHPNDLIRFLDDLDLDELNDLIERMDEHDCGVETSLEVECPECGNIQEVTVPLGGKEFFLPKRKRSTPSPTAS